MNRLEKLKDFIEEDGRFHTDYITELILENEKFNYLKSEKLNGMKIINDTISLEYDGDYIKTLDEFLSDYNDEFIQLILNVIKSFEKEED